jgi:hypothetical protein
MTADNIGVALIVPVRADIVPFKFEMHGISPFALIP